MPGYWDRFEPSRPLAVKGGIKSQSGRTGGQSWWARRWMEVLSSFDIGARVQRGRSYARSGQVLSIDVEQGRISARVQGSRPKPYQVVMTVRVLTPAQWDTVAAAVNSQALFAAKLLAGEIPPEIEGVFTEHKLSLFPTALSDLATDCSCPDWSNPCKHIAAVYYLLGEEFDRDPFLLFRLRGMSREDLLARLTPGSEAAQGDQAASAPPLEPEPLPTDLDAFWVGAAGIANEPGSMHRPPVHAALPRQLGSFPFWRGQTPFLGAMERMYDAASGRAVDAVAGGAVAVQDGDGAGRRMEKTVR